MLHRAANGEYEIRVAIYAADSINPNGANRVTAHLFREFGRKRQREEVIDIELRPGQSGDIEREKLVGKFVVEKNKKLAGTDSVR